MKQPISDRLLNSGVGADLLHASWTTWDGPRPTIETWPNPDACLTLSGPPGTGKSHAAVAIMREWLLAGPVRCLYLDTTEALAELRKRFGDQGGEDADEVLDRWNAADLLVLDEAYGHQGTEWADATVSRVIRQRMRRLAPLIVTTNLSEAELQRIEPRVGSRIAGSLFVTCTGRDRRRKA